MRARHPNIIILLECAANSFGRPNTIIRCRQQQQQRQQQTIWVCFPRHFHYTGSSLSSLSIVVVDVVAIAVAVVVARPSNFLSQYDLAARQRQCVYATHTHTLATFLFSLSLPLPFGSWFDEKCCLCIYVLHCMWIGSIRRALRIHIFPFFLIFLLSFHFYLIFLTPSPHRIVRHIESRTANEFSQFHASLFVALYFHLISLLVAFTYILLFVYFFILVFVLFLTVDRGGVMGRLYVCIDT